MAERKTIKKWFWVWEFEKEEIWLNAMAQSGWLLDGLGFCKYHFVACEPGTYNIRLEMRGHDEEYLEFMAETGAEYVGRMAKWIYFRKKVEDGPFDLFSDLDSRLRHLNGISRMLTIVGVINLIYAIVISFLPGVNMGLLNFLAASLVAYCLARIHEKKDALEQNRLLIE
jgi:hypothetical protein